MEVAVVILSFFIWCLVLCGWLFSELPQKPFRKRRK